MLCACLRNDATHARSSSSLAPPGSSSLAHSCSPIVQSSSLSVCGAERGVATGPRGPGMVPRRWWYSQLSSFGGLPALLLLKPARHQPHDLQWDASQKQTIADRAKCGCAKCGSAQVLEMPVRTARGARSTSCLRLPGLRA